MIGPKDADGIANSVDPDQTAPQGAVWSASALFVQTYLSKNLGSLRYTVCKDLSVRKLRSIMVYISTQGVRKNIKKEELKPTTQALEKVQALCSENKNASELIVDVSILFQYIK